MLILYTKTNCVPAGAQKHSVLQAFLGCDSDILKNKLALFYVYHLCPVDSIFFFSNLKKNKHEVQHGFEPVFLPYVWCLSLYKGNSCCELMYGWEW